MFAVTNHRRLSLAGHVARCMCRYSRGQSTRCNGSGTRENGRCAPACGRTHGRACDSSTFERNGLVFQGRTRAVCCQTEMVAGTSACRVSPRLYESALSRHCGDRCEPASHMYVLASSDIKLVHLYMPLRRLQNPCSRQVAALHGTFVIASGAHDGGCERAHRQVQARLAQRNARAWRGRSTPFACPGPLSKLRGCIQGSRRTSSSTPGPPQVHCTFGAKHVCSTCQWVSIFTCTSVSSAAAVPKQVPSFWNTCTNAVVCGLKRD